MRSQFEYYSTFYGVVLACTMLSNDNSDAFRRDAEAVVDFYCRARGFEPDVIAEWQRTVLDVMGDLSRMDEREATYSRRAIAPTDNTLELLYDVKGDVLSELNGKFRESTIFVNPSWFDYTHLHVYHPEVRFSQIKSAASSGWRIAARELGIMLALGIGCKADLQAAKRKFLQCAYWCDVPSVIMLGYVCRLTGDEEGAKRYGDLAKLLQAYLKDGITEIPLAERESYDPAALMLYAQVSSIYRDICCAYNRQDIDYSFVEVMMSDRVDDNAKMDYINNYDKKLWKDVTNPVRLGYGTNRIGFMGGNDGK